jgi:hypothetical protein
MPRLGHALGPDRLVTFAKVAQQRRRLPNGGYKCGMSGENNEYINQRQRRDG